MKKIFVLVAAVAIGVVVWARRPAHVTHDDQLVQDRLWIDHLPRGERDTVNVFAAITAQPIGM